MMGKTDNQMQLIILDIDAMVPQNQKFCGSNRDYSTVLYSLS